MRSNRRRDTGPELALRKLLHAAGLRYRVDHPLPFDHRRKADVAFTKQQIAVFIDGCFWHGCPKHFVAPKAHSDYWSGKIRRNIARDAETTMRLEEAGWVVLRFWEHEDPQAVARQVAAQVHH